jgi:hypothetical protein
MPWLAERHGWQVSLYVMGAFSLLGALCWAGIRPERGIDTEDSLLSL